MFILTLESNLKIRGRNMVFDGYFLKEVLASHSFTQKCCLYENNFMAPETTDSYCLVNA